MTESNVEVLACKVLAALDGTGGLEGAVKQFNENFLPIGRIVWTGFKGSQRSRSVVGQWLLWPPENWEGEERFYYSNVPKGGAGRYERGADFDIGPDKLTAFSTRNELKQELLFGLTRLFGAVLEDEPPWIKPWLDQAETRTVRPGV